MKQSITIKEIPNALDILTEARILALADAQVIPALTDSCGDVQRNGEGLPLFHPIAEEIVRQFWAYGGGLTPLQLDWEIILDFMCTASGDILCFYENLADEFAEEGDVPRLIQEKVGVLRCMCRDALDLEDFAWAEEVVKC